MKGHTPEREYDVQDVINAGCTLSPIRCRFCGSHEVDYNQYLHDALCGNCGKWQIEDAIRKAKGE